MVFSPPVRTVVVQSVRLETSLQKEGANAIWTAERSGEQKEDPPRGRRRPKYVISGTYVARWRSQLFVG
eukprot:5130038-Pleurochrysis_carterae.AAC.1